jgi:hypothetical protein
MATKKQKEELLEALKFTPRDITISLSGYGGEIVLGRISEAAYDYWQDRDDLADFVTSWDEEGFEDIPSDARFCTDGAWHDVDDICHESGCEASDCCSITVYDELEGRDLWESNLDLDNLSAKGVDTSSHCHFRPQEDEPDGTYVFLGQNFEKGTFFSGSIHITSPFDPKRLSISWVDCDGWRLISSVEYDGEDVEGSDGYSTTGKSMEFQVYQVENADMPENACSSESWDPAFEMDKIEVPVLEGEEMWASEAIDESMLTPWWPGDTKPVRKGIYEVEYETGSWPWPITAKVEWSGKKWKHARGEKTEIRQWRGLVKQYGDIDAEKS